MDANIYEKVVRLEDEVAASERSISLLQAERNKFERLFSDTHKTVCDLQRELKVVRADRDTFRRLAEALARPAAPRVEHTDWSDD